jgi:collagen type V/XI/XXIV/XXVII alpha
MVDDAVKVYCNMSSGETCVYPDVHTSKMPNIPWRKSGQGWYSELRGGFKVRNITTYVKSRCRLPYIYFQISYDSVGPIQMRFLRLLSDNARQNFTYTCINSVAWYDSRARNYQSSIKFLGDNEDEFSSSRNKPLVSHDGCRVSILKFGRSFT